MSVQSARFLTKTYEGLLSASSKIVEDHGAYLTLIDNKQRELEIWRDSIPRIFRPGSSLRPKAFTHAISASIALCLHIFYYNMIIVLSRLSLSACGAEDAERRTACVKSVIHAAFAILDLSDRIELEPYTPYW